MAKIASLSRTIRRSEARSFTTLASSFWVVRIAAVRVWRGWGAQLFVQTAVRVPRGVAGVSRWLVCLGAVYVGSPRTVW